MSIKPARVALAVVKADGLLKLRALERASMKSLPLKSVARPSG
jgi:hypothetical protein